MASIPGRKRQVEEDDILDWFGWDYDELKNDPNIALGTVADRSECSGFDKVLYMESNALILKGTWKGREAAFKVSRDNENAWNEIAALTAMEGDNHCVEALSWYTIPAESPQRRPDHVTVLVEPYIPPPEKRVQVTTWGNDGVGEVHTIPTMSNSGELRDYMEQLLEAIRHIHKRSWVHLDIKPSNILVEETPSGRGLTLIDFDVALKLDQALRAGIQYGTPFFQPPEVRTGDQARLSAKADIYSAGVTFALVASCAHPSADSLVFDVDDPSILIKRCDDSPILTGKGLKLVQAMTHSDPTRRPTALAALQHSYFS
ncbi:serine/threonine-protein kinase/endoribonuclease IRE1-like isoform X1 [Branchiostoma floridae]|uniref:Serine/threonine-protein kinase/endoribonuclease IRE1-like isoform X1 n=2 Tax=Branchiostoma floridae TaxID=7739 RepID=A0A9J7L8K2_BRAFL|nr:serine/threonine-protein kinase/endoribonuclease IRE1-like isoform X1 [Branchiostoma floridae]